MNHPEAEPALSFPCLVQYDNKTGEICLDGVPITPEEARYHSTILRECALWAEVYNTVNRKNAT